ncbi:FliI/YscN family ATPase [Ferrimonas sediminicola]|uniref:Flagellum-specific ATP synthase n=1 Tax=Ferrimonas sediminicola TaxID=2569538 RepID=A0A4U1BAG9_9GAMM|nr:FliI/YscN family ATPase [Ferrimonas sediminicola]TKB47826.1 FliI/YscN family ATPase [Ferrimonas sediminicola]
MARVLNLACHPKVPVATIYGRLVRVNGLMLEAVGCQLGTGDRCLLGCRDGGEVEAEVVGFEGATLLLMPLHATGGLMPGARVRPLPGPSRIPLGPGLLGRVLDGSGNPIDGKGPLRHCTEQPAHLNTPNPLLRRPIAGQLDVGVRALNALLPIGKGQRLGLFAGSGVGKSVLLGMMTRYTRADVVVVGLIGERGREVREFLDHALGEEGRRRAVVVAAPADTTPLMRLRAARLCHQIATGFRDQGQDVLLLMDSLTRYAQAQREIGLSLGEPPATRGYPPSAFSTLPSLVEMAGNGEHPQGSLSALYTVLAEGDDQQDPVADAARAILDGHIVLSRPLAQQGHFPAIDINASASRVADQIHSRGQLDAAQRVRRLLGRYQEVRELLPLGGYQPGQDPELDLAVRSYPSLAGFLQQHRDLRVSLEESDTALVQLLEELESGAA